MWCMPKEMSTKQQWSRIVLLRFSQPVHVFTILVVCYLSFLLFPRQKSSGINAQREPSSLAVFVYVTAFAIHFGAQFWMTFISGLVLFFNLPRHVFGQVQRLLFPKYFCLNSALGFVTLVLFVVHHPQWNLELQLQAWSLAVCFLSQLLIRMYIVPPMLATMEKLWALEAKAGVGMEVGRHDSGKLRNCPNYVALYRRFRLLHVTTAATNVIAFTCNAFHVYHLAKHITT